MAMVIHFLKATLIILSTSLLFGCIPNIRNTTNIQDPAVQSRTWFLIGKAANGVEFSYDPYSLVRASDGTWGFFFLEYFPGSSTVVAPYFVQINCPSGSYKEIKNSQPSANNEVFKSIPAGSVYSEISVRICGTTWVHDKKIYYFLVENPDRKITIWSRGNEVFYNGENTEIFLVYANSSLNISTPVQAVVNCKTGNLKEFDLLEGKILSNQKVSGLPRNYIGYLIYDRACNTERKFMVRNLVKPKDKAVFTQAQKRSAEASCEELGITKGTQPFNVCVQQLM
jgi:hypothetical protein